MKQISLLFLIGALFLGYACDGDDCKKSSNDDPPAFDKIFSTFIISDSSGNNLFDLYGLYNLKDVPIFRSDNSNLADYSYGNGTLDNPTPGTIIINHSEPYMDAEPGIYTYYIHFPDEDIDTLSIEYLQGGPNACGRLYVMPGDIFFNDSLYTENTTLGYPFVKR